MIKFFYRFFHNYCWFCLTPLHQNEILCQFCWQQLAHNQHACLQCATALKPSQLLCQRCLLHPLAISYCFSPFFYTGEIAQLIKQFKFFYRIKAGTLLSQLCWQALTNSPFFLNQLRQAKGLIAVPSDHQRNKKRGFDHTFWLTQQFAKKLKKPIFSVERLTAQPKQQSLTQSMRWHQQTKQQFKFAKNIPGSVIVLDDVITTGATLDALASAFLTNGGNRIVALVIARSLKHPA